MTRDYDVYLTDEAGREEYVNTFISMGSAASAVYAAYPVVVSARGLAVADTLRAEVCRHPDEAGDVVSSDSESHYLSEG